MSRALWFVAGAGAGVYALVKVRRAAEAVTPEGLRDRFSGASLGARLFADEVRTGMHDKETELRHRLGLALDGPQQIEARGAGAALPAGAETSPATADPTDTTEETEH